jgi:hypothetical protein
VRRELDAAVTRAALADSLQIHVVKNKPVQVGEYRRIGESLDGHDVWPLLQLLDGMRPPHDGICILLELQCREHSHLSIGCRKDASHNLAVVDQGAIGRGNRDNGSEEGKWVNISRSQLAGEVCRDDGNTAEDERNAIGKHASPCCKLQTLSRLGNA